MIWLLYYTSFPANIPNLYLLIGIVYFRVCDGADGEGMRGWMGEGNGKDGKESCGVYIYIPTPISPSNP